MRINLPHQTLLANAICWLLVWAFFDGSSARTCQLQQAGDWFDSTPWATLPLTYVVAMPGVFLLLLYFALCLKVWLQRKEGG
ncbi:MAG: hypothetical protein WC028_25445 [Candidatus Obscuribacterales bacterium]